MIRHLYSASRAIAVVSMLSAPIAGYAAAPQIPTDISAAVADAGRPQADRDRDSGRKPAESVAFAGIRKGEKVGELLAGGGYFTRILGKVVGDTGMVYATGFPPRPGMTGSQALEDIAADPGYKNVKVLRSPLADLKFPEPLDVVWTSLNYHDVHNANGQDTLNKLVFTSLKPGGTYLIIDHMAMPGSGSSTSKELHRIDSELVKKEVQSAGFKLVAEGDFLRNPDDPHTAGSSDASVRWHTDQFILKFVKPQ